MMGCGKTLLRTFALLIAVMLAAGSIGCGGNAAAPSAPSSTPTPTANATPPASPPSQPPVPPTPPPTPPPPPGPSSSPAQYQVTLFAGKDAHGQVTVDTSGNVTMNLTGATANATYSTEFCPFPDSRYSCFPLGSLATDGTGAGQTSFHFPKSGPWSGDFVVAGNNTSFLTEARNDSGQDFTATLEPLNVTNGEGAGRSGATSSSTPQDPGSGTLSVNVNVHLVLTGAAPNTAYEIVECFGSGGSSCYQLGPNSDGKTSFTTDASGNGTFDVPTSGLPADFFTVQRSGIFDPSTPPPAGFVAGFKVP